MRVKQITKDSVTLGWDVPDSDGGTPITNYVIERRDAGRNIWTQGGSVDGNTLTCKVPSLLEGKEYYFRVMARNAAGLSEPTETPKPIVVKSEFGEFHVFLDIHTLDL